MTNPVYRGYRPRPEKLPLRNGVVDWSMPLDYMSTLLKGYEPPPVEERALEPYQGITPDGKVIPGLFSLENAGLDSRPIVIAADDFIASLTAAMRERTLYPIDATQWRLWTNAFPAWEPHGVLLDEISTGQREGVSAILKASLSARGFADVRDAMHLNGELAKLIDQYHDTLKEWMYWFAIFGTPSLDEPWGWQLYGHHVDVNCFIYRRQIVLTPTFLGTEFESGKLFAAERRAALELMHSLSVHQQEEATLYRSILPDALPHELAGPIDGRNRAAAGQDNAVIPYEGIRGTDLTRKQRELLQRLADVYVSRWPRGPAEAKAAEIERHVDATHFAWIGIAEEPAAFYYKIHSPVVLIEYDNHPGVFLDNDAPEPFHVHTVVRTPNGNDYGKDILRQHYRLHHHAHQS